MHRDETCSGGHTRTTSHHRRQVSTEPLEVVTGSPLDSYNFKTWTRTHARTHCGTHTRAVLPDGGQIICVHFDENKILAETTKKAVPFNFYLILALFNRLYWKAINKLVESFLETDRVSFRFIISIN